MFHARKNEGSHLLALNGDYMIKTFNEINAEVYKNISTTGMYIIVDFDSKNRKSKHTTFSVVHVKYSKNERYDAQYTTLNELVKTE